MTGVDWSDPAARREWLELLRAKVVDLVAVGPTMPPGRSSDDDAKGPPLTLRPV